MWSRTVIRVRIVAVALSCVVATGVAAFGPQAPAMPNPKDISGVPLPVAEVPAGTVSVRVIRGDFSNNLAKQPVQFVIGGKTETRQTDADGRAQISGLVPGTHLKAVTVVDGERIESQDIAMGASGVRVVLVATDPEVAKREAEDRRLAASPPRRGTVVFSSESRVIAQFENDKLTIFYVLNVLNTARTPVEIGGPLIVELPPEAQGAAMLQESSKQATVNGRHVTVLGPFKPGATSVQVAFGLPFTGSTAHLEQKWPVPLEQVAVLVPQTGGLDFRSPQVSKKDHGTDQGQELLLGSGPALPAGAEFTLDVVGLPHHALWPRYIALTLAGLFMTMGIWAAATPSRRTA
jgi:hypothetical protein